jgi:adenylate kinase family enzyme
MKKILILGSGGAGKTTFALQLASKLALPLYHLDALYWKPNRQKPTDDEWNQTIIELLKKENWIIDGSYFSTLHLRVPEADTVIYLDIPNYLCIWNILKRRLKYAKWTGKTRPGLATHTSEKVYFSFLKWVWFYQKKEKPKVLQIIKQYKKTNVNILYFNNYASLEHFLNTPKQ